MGVSSAFAIIRRRHKLEAIKNASDDLLSRLSPFTSIRTTTPVLRHFLLNTCEPYYHDGIPCSLKKKSLGCGVYEVTLVPLKDK